MAGPILDYQSPGQPPRRRKAKGCLQGFLGAFLILSVWVAVAAPKYFARERQINIEAARCDISNLQVALDAFRQDVGHYPTATDGLGALLTCPAANATGWKGPYIAQLPADPWGKAYIYVQPGTKGRTYDIISCGPDGVLGSADNLTN
jgi:general secretion pathway protein G